MVASQETGLKKPQVYESKRIQITSPILHIGSEVQKLSPFEYVQTPKRVYLPNQEALARALQQRGRLNDYLAKIENRQEIAQLLEDTFGENWQNAKDSNGEELFPKIGIIPKWTDEKVTDLRPIIRNGMGQLYIPGSSIKGAIRTAIAYYLIKHESDYQVPQSVRVSEIEKKLREKLDNGELSNKHKQKFFDDNLFMNSLFSEFDLSYLGKSVKAKTGPNTDFMRAIKVSDSEPLIEETMVNKQGKPIKSNLPIVAEVIVSSRFPDDKAKYRASIYAEMVRNVRTEFTLTLDTEMLSRFTHKQSLKIPFKNLDELLKICQEFAQDQWDAEHDYWQNIKTNRHQGKNLEFAEIRHVYESEKCPFSLRMGWASGMLGTTIGLCLDEELLPEIRDTCGIPAPNFEAPKSRRTVVSSSGEIKYVPGWVKFKPC